jgi:hypothetical protein
MAFREASLETKASPADVWKLWSDIDHWPEWNPDMVASHLDGPLAVGTTGMIHTRSGGKHDVVVTHFENGKSFELESGAMPGMKLGIRATVTPSGAGTRITQAFEPRGPLGGVGGALMGGSILKTFGEVLAGLQKKVEAGR